MLSDIQIMKKSLLQFPCGTDLEHFILRFCCLYLGVGFQKDLNVGEIHRLIEEPANRMTGSFQVDILHLTLGLHMFSWPFDNVWKIAPLQRKNQKNKNKTNKPTRREIQWPSLPLIPLFPLLLIL